MATIKEDYVSFETAKLLTEKGFDEPCFAYYYIYNDLEGKCLKLWRKFPRRPANTDYLNVPTQQMAMKWLREVHNIFICILPSEVGVGVIDYTYVLYKIDAKNFYFENLYIQGRAKNISEISYEQTVESAIKDCLENLI